MSNAAAVALVEAAAASVGAMIGTTILYPLEVTKTKVQAFGGNSKTSNMGRGSAGNNTMWGALKQTYRTEGKWGLFAPYAPGWMAKMVDAGSFNFVFWFWFTVVTFVAERIGDNAGLDAMKGIIAAAINRLCTHPAENIASRMQTRLPDEPEEPYFAVAARICRESGIGGLWKGLGPAMILCINPTIDTFVYFRVRRAYLRWASARAGLAVVDVAGIAAFLLATFSKAIAATICYPMTRVKVMASAQRKIGGRGKIRGASEMASDLWASDGFWGFYYGAEGQIFNASVKQGLTLMMKERLQYLAFSILMPGHLARLAGTA